jgi:hypothetical protein
MSCAVCGPLPKREYGQGSGKSWDDHRLGLIEKARDLAASVVLVQAEMLRAELLRASPIPTAQEINYRTAMGMCGDERAIILKELEAVVAALRAPRPEQS